MINSYTLISSSSNDNTLSFVQDNGCDIGSGGFGYWYSTSSPLLIRMNLGEISVSIDEDLFDGTFSVYPNPSTGKFNIDLVNVNDGTYSISVENILGEEVYSEVRSVINTYSDVLDLTNLSKGVYMLNVKNETSSTSRKIIIE